MTTGNEASTARDILLSGGHSCVIMRDGRVLHATSGPGVRPLLQVYTEHPADLAGSTVADKVIGKAAAMILVLSGARAVHALVLSQAARDYLTEHGIAHSCDELVPLIENRDRTGSCPLEAAVAPHSDPTLGLAALRAVIRELMARH
jgi:hypothetical protein